MKKLSYLLTAAALSLGVAQVSADDLKYLNLQDQNGSVVSLSLSGLKLTFSDGVLTATQNGSQKTFTITDLNKMFFSAEETGIKSARKAQSGLELNGSNLLLNVPAGTVARIYDGQGRLVLTSTIAAEGKAIQLSDLQSGIYVVKAGEVTKKILLK
ncbi:MAG: T9SS type A sorting domain-containing protein [Bacteroidaceae bacterium]|nr:T9SS type A sorting domain-containing protein [Bacteroidaceae bacterium]